MSRRLGLIVLVAAVGIAAPPPTSVVAQTLTPIVYSDPSGGPDAYYRLGSPYVNARGDTVFWGWTNGNGDGIWCHRGSQPGSPIVSIATWNQTSPGGEPFISFSFLPAIDDTGRVAFRAGLGQAGVGAVFVHTGTTLLEIVRDGDAAPDETGASLGVFTGLAGLEDGKVEINARGDILFRGRFQRPDLTYGEGYWLADNAGNLSVVQYDGMTASPTSGHAPFLDTRLVARVIRAHLGGQGRVIVTSQLCAPVWQDPCQGGGGGGGGGGGLLDGGGGSKGDEDGEVEPPEPEDCPELIGTPFSVWRGFPGAMVRIAGHGVDLPARPGVNTTHVFFTSMLNASDEASMWLGNGCDPGQPWWYGLYQKGLGVACDTEVMNGNQPPPSCTPGSILPGATDYFDPNFSLFTSAFNARRTTLFAAPIACDTCWVDPSTDTCLWFSTHSTSACSSAPRLWLREGSGSYAMGADVFDTINWLGYEPGWTLNDMDQVAILTSRRTTGSALPLVYAGDLRFNRHYRVASYGDPATIPSLPGVPAQIGLLYLGAGGLGAVEDNPVGGYATLSPCGVLVFNSSISYPGVFAFDAIWRYQIPHPGDYNMDGVVNGADLAQFDADYAAGNAKADYDGDCALTPADRTKYLQARDTPHIFCGPLPEID